jgi:hypothetical protein
MRIQIQEQDAWVLPEHYDALTPIEKTSALRASILTFLNHDGPAPKSVISKAINAKQDESLKKALDYLAHTRQIYSESYGARVPIYFPNGQLGHPLYQADINVGNRKYAIRTYFDRITGKNVTLTESEVNYSGEIEPKGGIRIDIVDLNKIVQELNRINDLIQCHANVEDRGLLKR